MKFVRIRNWFALAVLLVGVLHEAQLSLSEHHDVDRSRLDNCKGFVLVLIISFVSRFVVTWFP